MSYSRLKQSLRTTTLFWLAGLLGVALWSVAQSPVDAQDRQRGPQSATAQQMSGFETQLGWTDAQMEAATPKDLLVYDRGLRPSDKRRSVWVANAQAGLVGGYDPAQGLASLARAAVADPDSRTAHDEPAVWAACQSHRLWELLLFQRWTHFGNYFTYPISTVGKLFFNQNGGSYVCSATVINRNTILTAGHCVHAGNNLQSGFSSNIVFCPSTLRAAAARRCARGRAWVPNQWFTSGLPDAITRAS